jgi:hypothetical protein
MTAPNTPPKDEKPQTPPADSGGSLNAGTLRQWIKEEIGNLLPGNSSGDKAGAASTKDNAAGDIKSQVAEALGQLKTREERMNRDKRVDAMLTEFEKPKEETAPVERRKVEKFMRWGD